MYQIYETKAYVLKNKLVKEFDQRILIFTEEFGLIWVNVAGSKKETSKFRNFLTDLTFCNIYLINGKNGYRITGGNLIENLFFYFQENDKNFKKKIKTLKNIFNLFEKVFLHNEKDKKIFNLLEKFILELKKKESEVEKLEIIFLLKLFYLWGYLDKKELLEESQNISKLEIKKLQEKINNNILKIVF